MGKQKTIVFIFTGLLAVLAVVIEFVRVQWKDYPVYSVVCFGDSEETVDLWEASDGTYCLFLPGCADLSRTRLESDRMARASVDGISVKNGLNCDDLPLDQPLCLRYRQDGRTRESQLIITRSGNTASLYIDVESGSMDNIHEKKGNSEPGSLRLYTADGTLDCSSQIKSVSGRGNSTWDYRKKPYNLELTSAQDLLGMGAAKKWILLANGYDPTNICDKMVSDFARETGAAYTAERQWVDLYLNGEYAGLYLLSERNELDPERIAVDADRSFLLSLSVDWQLDKSKPYIQSDRNLLLRIHQRGISIDEIWNIWQSAESAVYADDGIDPVTGKYWTELIDLDSWAQQFLLDEVFVDFDAFALSQYFYYEPDSGKLFGGPLWDSDNILDRCGKHPANILAAQRPYVWNEVDKPLCWALWQKEEFRQRVKELYRQEYRDKLLALANGGIENYVNQYRAAIDMDSIRWSKSGPDAEAARMSQYLRERVEFLDDYWSHEEEYVYLDIGADQQWRRFAVREGNTAECLREYTDNFGDVTWVRCDNLEAFDITQPVYEDTALWMIWPQNQEEET